MCKKWRIKRTIKKKWQETQKLLYAKFIPHPVDFNYSVNQRMAILFSYIVVINIFHKYKYKFINNTNINFNSM